MTAVDTTALRAAYDDLLRAAETVAEAGAAVAAPPDGEWNADQILAHVGLVTAATVAAAASVAAGANTTFDNRHALDQWTIDRVVARSGGSAALRERVRCQGEVLCGFGGGALSEPELDSAVPALLLSGGRSQFEGQMPLRDLIGGLASVELPGHTRQLLALLPIRAAG